jgi:hypothetical protein
VNVERTANADIGYLYLNDPTDSIVFTTYFLNQAARVVGGDGLHKLEPFLTH